ncbi:tRNA (adenosine(37)-N6)-threonylcarbamoyltransferase complex transferase subunit TsaD [archaeon]|jgi:N6-L-threonylcarbamoyladenine synthase|nr:tRNA (adenosine(37)-N6)-threonylcarbamoyltransferase complex transferase subunit TsaD [archaeon]MBT4242025.1 tRNA (adenosine(37)-N6)-threonylcarbamoyltransferase complex transferase subunit TsaD [archaeon]MBT4418572.1 tRNA (adenosine(37)-N6)-threonylcarbamoyltransferase complex transferase subunit TsaD [archaeon]
MAIIIGIESTAHTFGVGVVKNGKVLSNVREMYTTEKGGIIPIESAKHHAKIADNVWVKGLEEAGIDEKDIDAIAFSQSPGLAPCLIEGMKFAKGKAEELGVGLVGVNHCVAHLEIGRITGAVDPVLLYASGANTQIIAYESGKYRVFGETLDIGVGNFIDNFARVIGVGFPGGPKIMELAKKGKYIDEVPYKLKGMDVAFSGILTKLQQMYKSGNYKIEDLAFTLQETVFAMLVESAERALAHTGKNELLLGGGVGCNGRFQEMCEIMCKERGCKFFVPERPLLVDNGAMIAYLGEIMFRKGIFVEDEGIEKIDIDARERTDDVDVKWKE